MVVNINVEDVIVESIEEYINTFDGGCKPIHDKCAPEYSVLNHHEKNWIIYSIQELQRKEDNILGYMIKTSNGDCVKYNPSIQDYEYLSESGVPEKFVYSIDKNGLLTNNLDNSKFSIYWTNSGWYFASAKTVSEKGVTLTYVSPNAPNTVRALVFALPNATGQLTPGKLYPINTTFDNIKNYPIDQFTPYFELVPVYKTIDLQEL